MHSHYQNGLQIVEVTQVLILVVMEDALAHGGWAVKKLDVVRILILVVMEDALARMERRL